MSYKAKRTSNRFSYKLAFYGPVPIRKSLKALRLALTILWKALNGKYFMVEQYMPESEHLAKIKQEKAVLWRDK